MDDSSDDDSDDGISVLPIMMMALLAGMSTNVPQSMRDILSLNGLWARQGKICWSALQAPHVSVFWRLFNSQQDNALIALCGFDHNAFNALLELFRQPFYAYRPVGTAGLIQKVKPRNKTRG